jgi:hypothetical protein
MLHTTMPLLLGAVGTSANTFNYLDRSGLLVTKFAAARQGIPRPLTRENAVEIAFHASLQRLGVEPRHGRLWVEEWLKALETETLPDIVAIDRATGRKRVVTERQRVGAIFFDLGTPNDPFADAHRSIAEAMADRGLANEVSILNLRSIVERVDKLFAHDGDEKSAAA